LGNWETGTFGESPLQLHPIGMMMHACTKMQGVGPDCPKQCSDPLSEGGGGRKKNKEEANLVTIS